MPSPALFYLAQVSTIGEVKSSQEQDKYHTDRTKAHRSLPAWQSNQCDVFYLTPCLIKTGTLGSLGTESECYGYNSQDSALFTDKGSGF